MLVTPHVDDAATGGRALLSQLHLKCLKAVLADCLVVHALRQAGNSGRRPRVDALRGYIDGITPEVETAILAQGA